ncbi:hypothetical protein [Simplicispira psychrophila]|uniref:hypothetical protein n=1 Tax=Simplicispira psychrophila TaxID=80882 RepID=UPI0012EB9260|nr:hypothetical protein [Simplicispira psychrophila]
MTEGLILLTELGLLLLLLRTIFRTERKKSESDLGFFSYQSNKKTKENKSKKRRKFHA